MTTPENAEPTVVETAATTTAVVRAVVPMTELAPFFDRSFRRLSSVISSQGASIIGPAFARYHGSPSDTADLEVGFATAQPVRPDGDVQAASLPGGRVARLVHAGSFDELTTSWGRLRSWIDERGLIAGPDLWEVYLTEPSPDMDPADLRTELNWSVASDPA